MRKLITAGLAALLLSASIPSDADALGGRRGRSGKSAKASKPSASWGQPKASKAKAKKKGGGAKPGIGATNKLPNVSLPKGLVPSSGGARRTGGGAKAKKGGAAPMRVDYKAAPPKSPKTKTLINGGLGEGNTEQNLGGGKKRG